MDYLIAALLFALIILVVVVVLRQSRMERGRGEAAAQIDEQIDGQRREVAELKGRLDQLVQVHEKSVVRIDQMAKGVQASLTQTIEKSGAAAEKIVSQMAQVQAVGQQISGQSKELAQSISAFERLFSSPKLRGGAGEFQLEEMLRQFIPAEQYQVQFSLDGKMVDAVIKTREGLIPIDSKFPLESYNRMTAADAADDEVAQAGRQFDRDVRKHIDDIADKYIVPGKTLPFAFVFVPAEAVYAALLERPGLNKYALDKHVIPASPNSFFAYLQALGYGFRGMKIEESARRMANVILAMKKEFDRFKGDWQVLGTHLSRAQAKYSEADRDIDRFDRTIGGLQTGQAAEPTLPADQAGALPTESAEDSA